MIKKGMIEVCSNNFENLVKKIREKTKGKKISSFYYIFNNDTFEEWKASFFLEDSEKETEIISIGALKDYDLTKQINVITEKSTKKVISVNPFYYDDDYLPWTAIILLE